MAFDSFDMRQLRLLVTAVSAQKLFWTQQEALARAANDAELSVIASRFVRDHARLLDVLNEQLGGIIQTDALPIKAPLISREDLRTGRATNDGHGRNAV